MDGQPYLTAINTGIDVPEDKRVSDELLGSEFEYIDGKYQVKRNSTLNTVKELREELYKNGFYCDGVHYVRFKRSTGSSRVGKCLYVDEKLYPRLHKWESLRLKIEEGQAIDLAAYEAYIALTLSSIIDTIDIKPENILLIDDFESVFQDDVIATTFDEAAGSLRTEPIKTTIRNSLWDGLSLIDKSLMGKYDKKGMVVLRTNFFKTCAFNTNVQQFLIDNDITSIEQLNGRTIAKDIKDIKLITTPSSIKFLKFGTFKQWIKKIDTTFGIVKHDKKTHYFDGRMVQTHYQLLNTLQLSKKEMADFLKPSLDYLSLIAKDPAVLRYYIKYPTNTVFEDTPINTKDKNEIVFRLMGINENFCNTTLYKQFKTDLIRSYKSKLRAGHVLVKGNYSTLLGNPMEMLLHAIGKFNGESYLGTGCVCNTTFANGEVLLGSRSPHVCQGNILLTTNKHDDKIFTYFNLTDEIVCINSINENILQRLSGADYDGDTMLLTNNLILITAAQRNYNLFGVPTCMVDSVKSKRFYTDEQKADLDFKTSVNKIGEIVNLSQQLVSLYWDKRNRNECEGLDEIYYDICQLDVMSGIEIDKAKKEFPEVSGVGINELELKRIRSKYSLVNNEGKKVLPYFFKFIEQVKRYYNPIKKVYKPHATSMDYLQQLIDEYVTPRTKTPTLHFFDILDFPEYKSSSVWHEQICKVMELVSQFKKESTEIWNDSASYENKGKQYLHYLDLKNSVCREIRKINMGKHTMYWLLKGIDSIPEFKQNKTTYMNILFNISDGTFYELIKASTKNLPILQEDCLGSISIHDFKFTRIE